LTWWLDHFPWPYFYSEVPVGKSIITDSKESYSFDILRTAAKVKMNLAYPFKIKADTDQEAEIKIRVQADKTDPYEKLGLDFKDRLNGLLRAKPDIGEQVLALEAAETLTKENFPNVKDPVRELIVGQLLHGNQFYESATAAYKKAESLDPQLAKNPQYNFFLGAALFSSHDTINAAERFAEVHASAGGTIYYRQALESAMALGVPPHIFSASAFPNMTLTGVLRSKQHRIGKTVVLSLDLDSPLEIKGIGFIHTVAVEEREPHLLFEYMGKRVKITGDLIAAHGPDITETVKMKSIQEVKER
jgi:hypothetical protein